MIGIVIAGGPSGTAWRELDRPGAIIAAVNGSIRDEGVKARADYAVCIESECMDSWIGMPIPGTWILESSRKFVSGPHELYGRSLYEPDPRRIDTGLLQFEGPENMPLIGGSTVAAMHYLCAKGITELHTIGLDLCFKEAKYWHVEEGEKSWKPVPAGHEEIEYCGLPTLTYWAWCAVKLHEWGSVLAAHGIKWIDHSDGLLQRVADA